jgi:hypothetical protein
MLWHFKCTSISENSFCVLQKDMKVVERPKPMITDPVSPSNLSLSLYFQVRLGFSFASSST